MQKLLSASDAAMAVIPFREEAAQCDYFLSRCVSGESNAVRSVPPEFDCLRLADALLADGCVVVRRICRMSHTMSHVTYYVACHTCRVSHATSHVARLCAATHATVAVRPDRLWRMFCCCCSGRLATQSGLRCATLTLSTLRCRRGWSAC